MASAMSSSPLPEPRAKKAKVQDNVDEALVDILWQHFQNFLESSSADDDDEDENSGGGGGADIDELQELVDFGEKRIRNKPTFRNQESPLSESQLEEDFRAYTQDWTSPKDLLHVLMSVAYYNLAEASISEYLMLQQQQQQQQASVAANQATLLHDENMQLTLQTIQKLLTISLLWCPYNANTWSMGGNFGRMSQTLSLRNILYWMERAAQTASLVRRRAMEMLLLPNDDDEDDEVKHWIEVLLLNQMVGVEWEDENEQEEEKEEEEEEDTDSRAKDDSLQNEYENANGYGDDDDTKNESFENEYSEKGSQDQDEKKSKSTSEDSFENEYNGEDVENDDDENNVKEDSFQNEFSVRDIQDDDEESSGQFGASSVESTARFMCAMLWSMEGRHDNALKHMKHFPLTHRLHPNVWKPQSIASKDTASPTVPPLMFQPSDGILPPQLYNALVKLFAPNAAYWSESNYANRGYFSYFTDHDPSKFPENVLEDVIVHHLLPRAQQCLNSMKEEGLIKDGESIEIKGFEWWAHTRPIQANLGHNLHFDTDESMLDQEGKVTHPILSSVLYLTGQPADQASSPAGATIVLDQTPDSKLCAEKCWQGIPHDNSFLLFPGNRLHGVLPCPGEGEITNDCDQNASSTKSLVQSWKSDVPSIEGLPHRLTFMVGFWTRNVPATMKNRCLYGPCGPLPPPTEEHTWVQEIQQGYENGTSRQLPTAPESMDASPLPCVSPAWEVINSRLEDNLNPPLKIPHSIDHRFFVEGAPECFRKSLFEDREAEC